MIAHIIALADRAILRLGWLLFPNTMLRLEDRRLAREGDREMRRQLDRVDPWGRA